MPMAWRLSSHCFPVGVIECEPGGPLDIAMAELTARWRGVVGEGGFGDGRHEATWLLLLNNWRIINQASKVELISRYRTIASVLLL